MPKQSFPLAERDRATLQAWHDIGWSWRRLADLTGVQHTTLRYTVEYGRPARADTLDLLSEWCADHRAPLPAPPRREKATGAVVRPPASRVIHPYQVGELARAGYSIPEVAARYHTSERRIADLLRRHRLARGTYGRSI